ncbi:MAG: hypothetical protein C3F06_01115 [Candidatus Methanoperedenaceae archaeon]|nr:MAG: hypothetical protein C3F06_01115 [Candidatus Methanoperedenaceae archaeon]
MAVNAFETIRKLTGWCPNARALEKRQSMQFDNISVVASGGIGGAIKGIAEQPKIKIALMIVGIFAILNALGVYLTAKRNSEIEYFMSIDWRLSFVSALIAYFLLWLIVTSPGNPIDYRKMYSNHYILGSTTIAIIMQVMSSIILFFGIQNIHRLTPIKSAIVAGIPLAFKIISIAWIFWSFIL